MEMLTLSEADVERLLDVERLVEALAHAFTAVSDHQVSVPRRIAATVEETGLLAAMPGYARSIGLGTKLVSVFHRNGDRGLPSHQAIICLFDEETGTPLAVMGGTHVTAVRTAAASALSTRILARKDARVLAVLGAGVQARSHLRLLQLARAFDEIRIASRTRPHAEALAASTPRARAVDSFALAIRGADVVAACTHSGEPVVHLDLLSPGTHVTSVGYAGPRGELDRAVVERASLFVESRVAFDPPPGGCYELAGIDPARGVELGEVLAGRKPGRRSDEEITVYKSMGHAVEDLAAAKLVYEEALRVGAGTRVAL